MEPVTSLAVANYFIQKAAARGTPLTHLKVQKLLYFSHGWVLALYGVPLINEYFEAWRHGPVAPNLYHELKSYGAEPITQAHSQATPSRDRKAQEGDLLQTPVLAESHPHRGLLDCVFDAYAVYSPQTLSDMTHSADSPWDLTLKRAQQEGFVALNVDIPNRLVQTHFVAHIHAAEQGAYRV